MAYLRKVVDDNLVSKNPLEDELVNQKFEKIQLEKIFDEKYKNGPEVRNRLDDE